jgi:NitT/TauT family transport system substrate-binding protein
MQKQTSRILTYVGLIAIAAGATAAWWYLNNRDPKGITVGLVTWVGYGPLFIAEEKGYFREEGLPQVALKTLDGPGEREAAFQAGQIDLFPNTPDAFVIFFANQQPKGRIVAALDESAGADGIVAKQAITTPRDLKGKSIGYQSGITSHFLLLYVLDKYGLTGRDVKQENLNAGDAGAAFMAGRLDAAVTWEPWLSKAKSSKDAHILATSADTKGLIVDVVLASENMIKSNPEGIRSFIRAWHRAVEFLQHDPSAAQEIIAKRLNLKREEAAEMLSTTKFLSKEEGREYLQTGMSNMAQAAARLFVDNGIISKPPNLQGMVDASYYPK